MDELPTQIGAGDVVHTSLKTGLSMIPILGSPLAELFNASVTAPLAHRRDRWFETLAKELEELKEKSANFDLTVLCKNEDFLSILSIALVGVLKTSSEQKHEAFKNVVINSVRHTRVSFNYKEKYASFIETHTDEHFKMLNFFANPRRFLYGEDDYVRVNGYSTIVDLLEDGNFKSRSYKFEDFIRENLCGIVIVGDPELDFILMIVNDLNSQRLIKCDLESEDYESYDKPKITSLGKEYLKFITSPEAAQ
jgi:hypothetical protein